MLEEKEEPLNINLNPKAKGKQNNPRQRKRDSLKKSFFSKPSSISVYVIIFIIFFTIFFFFTYLIYKNLKNISELNLVLKNREKELEDGEKTRIELLEKIDTVERQIELKKRYIKERKKIDSEKFTEYNQYKKIYENLEDIQNKIIDETNISLVLDEAINNLNKRVKNLEKKNK